MLALILSLALSHLFHRRKVAAQIEQGIADARDILDSTAEGIMATNSSGEITKFNLTADGSYWWVADSRTMVNNEEGQPHLLIGCWTDIHDKKETESNLALKEERLSISLKCANLATWDWVINSGKITWSGHINEKPGFSGKLAADFDDFSAIAHPEDRENLLAAFRQCLVQDESLDIEYRVVWPDKSVHWIHLVGELINDEAGSPVRMAGVLFDITAQKQLRVAPSLGVKRA